jgi:hypothetical protein
VDCLGEEPHLSLNEPILYNPLAFFLKGKLLLRGKLVKLGYKVINSIVKKCLPLVKFFFNSLLLKHIWVFIDESIVHLLVFI